MLYFVLGVLAPLFINLLHLVVGLFIVLERGNILSLGFTGISFITKTMAMLFLTWVGVSKLELDYQIYVPLLTFFWFFSHVAEAFVIKYYMEKNIPKWIQDLQLK